MIIPCEIASKSVVPAIKALIAQELVDKHGLKQNEVAEILRISQSAVSKYTRKVRGHAIEVANIEEIQPFVAKMIDLLVGRTYRRGELMISFCQTCKIIRATRLMCPFCHKTDSSINIKECDLCLSST